jgi:signal transduction histidine kinase
MKISPQSWRIWHTGLTVNKSMHRLGVGFSVARAIPGPGIELDAVSGTSVRVGASTRGGFALVTVAVIGVLVSMLLVRDPGDVALTAMYSVLIGAAATAVVIQRQRRAAAWALDEERQRIARNLHDGLAQELAYIRMETQRMAATQSDGRFARLALAAERALQESRGAIEELRSGGAEQFSVELLELADELAAREGVRVRVWVDPGLEVESADRDALLRIMREAICNGVRHGQATELALELSRRNGIRMAVRDNGIGFKPGGARRRESFGLTSMRERARARGGDVVVQSAPGEGTLVEVTLP